MTAARWLAVGVLGAGITAALAWSAPSDGRWLAVRVGGRTIARELVAGDVRTVEIALADGLRTSAVTVDRFGRVVPVDGRDPVGFDLDAVVTRLRDGETRAVPIAEGPDVRGWRLYRDGDVVTATNATARAEFTVADGVVVTSTRGPFVRIAVSERPDLEVFDPTVFDQPTVAWPGAREARSARFTLDGVPLVIETPLAAELPAVDLARVRAWLAAVDPAGDCQAQSRDLIARATAEGYAARLAEGWVYRDEPRPAFVPHAWVLVRIGDREVPVDPALGEVVADASHVPAPLGEAWFYAHVLARVTP